MICKNNLFDNIMKSASVFCQYIFGFICMMVFSSGFIGTAFVFLDWHWGWLAIFLTAIFSCAGSVYLKKKEFFKLSNIKEFISVFVLGMIALFIYTQYAPTLEVHQDPSVYMYKSLNLVNYGYVYQPMEIYENLIDDGVLQEILNSEGHRISHNGVDVGYAILQNGTSYESGELATDFFAGGSFVYAIMGKIYKPWIFYGQTVIMLVSVGLFYFALKYMLREKWNALYSVPYILSFFLAPVIVFFGRGSFSEPIALAMLLFIICLLGKIREYKKIDLLFLSFSFLVLYSARMDYLLLAVLGVFIITYINKKIGALYSGLLIVTYFVFNKSYWIYSYRIFSNDMPFLKYGAYLIVVAYIISFLVCKYGKQIFHKIYFAKYTRVLYFIGCMAVLMLMFRDNIISPENYEIAMIHGVEQMTYVEFIFDLLFMVFPPFIIIGGILCLQYILSNTKIPFVANIFIIGTISMYMEFFIGAGNSPMLYWLLRRFFYVILPVLTISFILFFMNSSKKMAGIVGIICMLMAVNLLADSKLTVDYQGLDYSVEEICEEWEEQNIQIVLYDTDMRYQVSSIMVYSDIEFIPYTGVQVYDILQYLKDNNYDLATCIILTDAETDDAIQYQISYNKQSEALGGVPRSSYGVSFMIYGYTYEQCMEMKNNLYPSLYSSNTQGFYEDSKWTGNTLDIEIENFNVEGENEFFVIELNNDSNVYLENGELEELNVKIVINEEKELLLSKYENKKLYFEFPRNIENVKKLQLSVNTFNCKSLGVSEDTRDLGLNIKSIYIQPETYIYTKLDETKQNPTIFMQFYDWFREENWKEDEFVDKIDWSAIEVYDEDRGSEEFYYKMFKYIKELGVDALSWEYYPDINYISYYPSENVINALRRSGLKIACFYDYEMAIKSRSFEEGKAILSENGSINTDNETISSILKDLENFYKHVPKDLLAYDKEGRQVIYVYGYDFDDNIEKMDEWDGFANKLINGVKQFINGETPAFYWTCKNSSFEEHLYQHYSDNFVPFQFVLDTPQSQFSSSSVTWNLGYDNLGVQVRDNLERVVRLDERYIQEMGWLSAATDCDAVFIYGWNEPYEGSMALPTEMWGDTKAQLVKQYIDRLKNGTDKKLKKTILIVDNLNNYYENNTDNWHYIMERQMLLYPMRRYLPQADVYLNTSVTAEILDKYECIVDISVDKDKKLCELLLKLVDSKQILSFDPKAEYEKNEFTSYFIEECDNQDINKEVSIAGHKMSTFIRDDVIQGKLTKNTEPLISILNNSESMYGALKNADDILVSIYNADDNILKQIFEEFYQSELSTSIMYGEGYDSQRLEIDVEAQNMVENTCERYSINGHWKIPSNIFWRVMPEGIPEDYYNFIFGIE